jgi:hypothetical protein
MYMRRIGNLYHPDESHWPPRHVYYYDCGQPSPQCARKLSPATDTSCRSERASARDLVTLDTDSLAALRQIYPAPHFDQARLIDHLNKGGIS